MNAPPFSRMVPIRRADGTPVTNFVSAPTWKDLKAGKTDAVTTIDPAEILAEEHHRAYGRPWVIGRCYFDYLIQNGLQPQDKVLDLGCGAGRVGIWLIPFLETGNYYGIDHHLATLAAFAGYECAIHDLFGKSPNLMLDDEFRVEHFNARFDVVLDLYVSAHLQLAARERLYRRLASACAPGARVFVPHKPKLPLLLLQDLGFHLVKVEKVEYPILRGIDVDFESRDKWHEFRFAP